MNMPVLPATNANPPPSDSSARVADAGGSDSAHAFSAVLSEQRTPAGKSTAASKDPHETSPHPSTVSEPQDPEATLALILDSAGLALMQAPVETSPLVSPADTVTQTGQPKTDTQADTATPETAGILAALLAPSVVNAPNTTASATATSQALTTSHGDPADASNKKQAISIKVAVPSVQGQSPTTLATLLQEQTPAHSEQALLQAASSAVPPARALRLLAPEPAADSTPQDTTIGLTGMLPAGASLLSTSGALTQTPVITLAVPTPLGSPQWAQNFGQQILAIAQSHANGLHTVQLNVNPPDLGPVHITLQIGDSSTQAAFMSPHAHVRQILENSLPSLAQQFAQAGLSLGQANVSDQQPGQQGFGQPGFTSSGSGNSSSFSLAAPLQANASPQILTQARSIPPHPESLVDTFV